MKRTLLAVLLALSLPSAVVAQTQQKPVLPKMTLEEFVRQAGTQSGFHNGLPPTTIDTFQLAQAQTDPQRTAMVQKLYELSQDRTDGKIVPVRGGTPDKPLGCYLGGKDTNIEFKSGYKDVDGRTQCEWAYDLHEFIIKNGGGYDNYRKYLQGVKPGNEMNESLRSYAGGKDPNDAFDRAHVSYDKQAAFADTWWKANSQAYKKTILPPKDWWTNDAVLDGNNLYTRWEMTDGGKGSSDMVSWRDADLATLMEKK